MAKISTIRGVFMMMGIGIFSVLLFHIQKPVLSRVADSTPQAYLPVIQKPSGTSPTPTLEPTLSPTIAPTRTSTPTVSPPSTWLEYVNWLRSLGGLPSLVENIDWSSGDLLHARYMVKNDYVGHSEDPSNEYYTAAGAAAAGNSDVMVNTNINASDVNAIDLWMSGPFHGIGIIDPALISTGFGSYREADGAWQMGAALDVLRGLGEVPGGVTFPIFWPGMNGTMPYTAFNGGEWPDPLASCPGYSTPSGPPIYLQVGDGSITPSISAHSFLQEGSSLQHCIFDETSYTNSDINAQDLGRAVLNMRDAIVIMPREPLIPDETYTISITINGTTYTWSFTVSGTKNLPPYSSEIH